MISAIRASDRRRIVGYLDGLAGQVAALEQEIDDRVYRLYGLTPAEIKIVESASVPRGGTTADKESAKK